MVLKAFLSSHNIRHEPFVTIFLSSDHPPDLIPHPESDVSRPAFSSDLRFANASSDLRLTDSNLSMPRFADSSVSTATPPMHLRGRVDALADSLTSLDHPPNTEGHHFHLHQQPQTRFEPRRQMTGQHAPNATSRFDERLPGSPHLDGHYRISPHLDGQRVRGGPYLNDQSRASPHLNQRSQASPYLNDRSRATPQLEDRSRGSPRRDQLILRESPGFPMADLRETSRGGQGSSTTSLPISEL